MKKVILTGDRPTGKLHLGHFVGSLKNRVRLQDEYEQYVMIADSQALTDHAKEPQVVRKNVFEVALDYLAVGIDPSKTHIFIQSLVPQLPELAMYYLNLVTWNRLKHNPTVKAEIVQKGFGDSVPAGFMTYPIFQAADITAFEAEVVPVGADQLPMIEQTNELVRSFHRIYGDSVLKECEAYTSNHGRLPGIDGSAKMSKTLDNAIYLSEDLSKIKKKIMKMPSDPDHTDINAPGQVEGNCVFTYFDAVCDDQNLVKDLKDHYQKGGLGDGTLKKELLRVVEGFLKPIQEKRAHYESNPELVWSILQEGTKKAVKKAEETMQRVRKAMHLDYFLS